MICPVCGAPSDQCSGGMTCTHRAALKRCHELLQEAHAYVPENEAWHDQVTEILAAIEAYGIIK